GPRPPVPRRKDAGDDLGNVRRRVAGAGYDPGAEVLVELRVLRLPRPCEMRADPPAVRRRDAKRPLHALRDLCTDLRTDALSVDERRRQEIVLLDVEHRERDVRAVLPE